MSGTKNRAYDKSKTIIVISSRVKTNGFSTTLRIRSNSYRTFPFFNYKLPRSVTYSNDKCDDRFRDKNDGIKKPNEGTLTVRS